MEFVLVFLDSLSGCLKCMFLADHWLG
jgi:hypothetical protein